LTDGPHHGAALWPATESMLFLQCRYLTGPQRDIFAAMKIGPLSTVDFVCMNCQLPHRATRQQSTEQLSGSFECEECHQPVHGWTGFEDFFDWHPIKECSRSARGPKYDP
jgi:hypothetical protein